MSWKAVFENPRSSGGFHSPETARLLGDTRYRYILFADLSSQNQTDARRKYPYKKVGAMYDFRDEHYYYPIKRDGTLARAQRVLAIPNDKIWDKGYMSSLGYGQPRSGFTR